MLKKLLNGLIFGTGFGLAFVIIWIIAIYFVLPKVFESKFESGIVGNTKKEISTAPSINTPTRFLGSPAIHSSGFTNEGVLSKGPGEIIGNAVVNGELLVGLKLRLALNGTIMSQWATTDSNGQYIISVPYGKYIIDGFELDQSIANKVLPNKINHPQIPHSSRAFEVTANSKGRGLNFKFVDPIIKKFEKSKYSVAEDIILEWEQYPGASQYSIQIYEKSDPHSWSNNTLFKWSDQPKLTKASIKLNNYDVNLKPGYFYVVEIDARNKGMAILSETARTHTGYDFEVVE